jgi:predicted nucleic acid-binding Zn ribbon protein
MPNPNHRGPRPLSDVLGELFTVRGYSKLKARQELEEAWKGAVGEPVCHQTRLGELRRGILNVTVAHSALLAELAAFRKPSLLAAIRASAPASTIHDIRFRVGIVAGVAKPRRSRKSDLEARAKGNGPISSDSGSLSRDMRAGRKQGDGSRHGPIQP